MRVRRLLFCLPTTALSGGAKIIFEFANRLADAGMSVDIFTYTGSPAWFPLRVPIIPEKDLADVSWADYDCVLICHAFLIPVVLSHLAALQPADGKDAACMPCLVYFCQDYESFHHGQHASYADFIADDPVFAEIYKLSLPIITVSSAVRALIHERIGRDAYYAPLGIDKDIFRPQPAKEPGLRKRVLMIGNYLWPSKGMPDAFEALAAVSQTVPLELVLVTPETRNSSALEALPFPVEVHRFPDDSDMPGIFAGCDVFCCASWYEGLGLPGIEAFHCGTPVVSTRDYGVDEYGIDGVNILLADPNDPQDLAQKLHTVLTDSVLAARLRREGFRTVECRYSWNDSVVAFRKVLDAIDLEGSFQPIDPEYIRSLVEKMESEGNYTPAPVNARYQELSRRLNDLCREIAAGEMAVDTGMDEVREIVDGLQTYLTNPKAEYYASFRRKYDFGRVVLSLAKNPRMREALGVLLDRKSTKSTPVGSKLREVIYE